METKLIEGANLTGGTIPLKSSERTPYDDSGNATHYSDTRINVIFQLEQIWGSMAVVLFCEMNAFKYRARLGKKDDPKQELIKIAWYEKCADIFRARAVIGVDKDLNNLIDHKFNL